MVESDTYANQLTVLVIEDDPDMAGLIRSTLSDAGYNVFTSFSGEDGLEKARLFKPDLILLDIMLPRMDGIEVCRALVTGQETARIPIVMVTVKTELSTKLSSYIAGARRYITKPFSPDDLLNTVRVSLRQSHHPESESRIQQNPPE